MSNIQNDEQPKISEVSEEIVTQILAEYPGI